MPPAPPALPLDLAQGLDLAGYLVGHDAPARRRRGLDLAAQVEARAAAAQPPLAPGARDALSAELAAIRAVAAASARRLRRRAALLGRETAGGVLFALLSVGLLELLWARDWPLDTLPPRFVATAPPQRTATWVTVAAPGTGEGEPGVDSGPVAVDGEAARPPEPEPEPAEAPATAEVVAPPQPLRPAPGDPAAPPRAVPAEASSPPEAPAHDGPEPSVAPAPRTLSRLIAQVGPKSDAPREAAAAPPEAEVDPEGAEAVAVVATPTRPTAPDARPTPPPPPGPLPPLVLPDLPAGAGEGLVALAQDAPLGFIAIGPQPATRSGRRGAPGLEIARTEVTQAQWAVIMHLDLASISGQWDLPAEAMSWCEAVRFANALSEREGLPASYEVGRDCERGGKVRWDTRGEGFRLLTEGEWVALARAEGRPEQAQLPLGVARLNNRGIHAVEAGDDQQAHGVRGIDDNAREWIWGRAPLPAGDAPDGERYQVHRADYSRAVTMGCASVTPEEIAAAMAGDALPALAGGEEWCRRAEGAAAVPLGVGLRLGRGAPPELAQTVQ